MPRGVGSAAPGADVETLAPRVPSSAFPSATASAGDVVLTEIPDIPGLEVQEDGSLHLTDGQSTWGLVRVTDDPPETIAEAGRAYIFKAVTHNGLRQDSLYAYVVRPDGLREFLRREAGQKRFVRHSVSGPAVVHPDGAEEWHHMGRLNRENAPAITRPDGSSEWWLSGRRHRDMGRPAVETPDGSEWWLNGKRHRMGGPAIEEAGGLKEWWREGELHREDGPAREDPEAGCWEWFQHGKRHRVGGLAVETRQGAMEWWFKGARHNTEGPAIIDVAGEERWFLEGHELSKRDWLKALGRSIRPKPSGVPSTVAEAMRRR